MRFCPASHRILAAIFALGLPTSAAVAGPPYISDDPEPTDYQHYEIYFFTLGTHVDGGTTAQGGIDFNYGAAPDLQLTASLPLAIDSVNAAGAVVGLGSVKLAAKYRFLHQTEIGWDVAVFPRLFLPTAPPRLGSAHPSFLLPIWVQRDWGDWSIFGGGGCALNRGGDSQDFCLTGGVLTFQLLPKLQVGAEISHQTPDTKGARPTTGLGFGVHYDLTDNYHLVAYVGPGLQNAAITNRYSWYAAMLLTF